MNQILLLHEALGRIQQLSPLKHRLTNKGFSVFELDFSGHGGKPFRPAFGIEQFADEVDEFVKYNQLDSFSIFGYNMRGYVALWYANQ